MPILYKIITAVLSLTGCTSLLVTGWMNLFVCAGGLSIFAGYYRFFNSRAQASKHAAAILAQAALVLFLVDAIVITRDVFLAVAHLTIIFQGIKSFDLKEPWDHLQVYFMSLLQLIIASELTSSLIFGVIFMVFMILLVTAMVLSHFLKEGTLGKVRVRRPVVVIVLMTILCTIVLFIIIPRTPYRSIGKSHVRGIKTVGFSDKVDFGSFGDVKLDPAVVMRVEFDREVSPPYYWRGMALDYFDGTTWRNTESTRYRIQKVSDEFRLFRYNREAVVEQRIFLEPVESDVIFGMSKIVSVEADLNFLSVDTDMAIYMPGKLSRRMKYTVRSDMYTRYGGRPEKRYLQLPPDVGKITELAGRVAGTGTALQKAVSLEAYLNRGYSYSLSTAPPRAGVSVIEDFLFESKKGYCEHYASSLVLMLRSVGIPARVVTGFGTGEKNEYGNYVIVRQRDAHAWVEALIDGEWKRFDPTPAVVSQKPNAVELYFDSLRMQWMRYVVGFSFDDQKAIARFFTWPFRLKELPHISIANFKTAVLILLMSAASVMAAIFVVRRFRLARHGFVTQNYLQFRGALKRQGIKINDSMTSGDLRSAVKTTRLKDESDEFLSLYESHRFGNREMDRAVSQRYKELLRKLKAAKRSS